MERKDTLRKNAIAAKKQGKLEECKQYLIQEKLLC